MVAQITKVSKAVFHFNYCITFIELLFILHLQFKAFCKSTFHITANILYIARPVSRMYSVGYGMWTVRYGLFAGM